VVTPEEASEVTVVSLGVVNASTVVVPPDVAGKVVKPVVVLSLVTVVTIGVAKLITVVTPPLVAGRVVRPVAAPWLIIVVMPPMVVVSEELASRSSPLPTE